MAHPGALVLVTFATECMFKMPAAGAAEVLQNFDNGIRATASCPHPPSRAQEKAQFATLLRGEATIIERHAICHKKK